MPPNGRHIAEIGNADFHHALEARNIGAMILHAVVTSRFPQVGNERKVMGELVDVLHYGSDRCSCQIQISQCPCCIDHIQAVCAQTVIQVDVNDLRVRAIKVGAIASKLHVAPCTF